jgi:hypothetical protein
MQNIIESINCYTSFFEDKKIEESDFEKRIRVRVLSDTEDLFISSINKEEMDGTIFRFEIGIGDEEDENTITADVRINELELFASSILNHIEIVRKNYGEQIKKQLSFCHQL